MKKLLLLLLTIKAFSIDRNLLVQDTVFTYQGQLQNGGDVRVDRKFPGLLRTAGLESRAFSASYECYKSPASIGEYLAQQLMAANETNEGSAEAMEPSS